MARLPVRLLKSRPAWVTAFALLVLWLLTAYPRGAVMAYADRARGHREVKVYGYPPRERAEYARLLRERYGVKLNAVAGCVVTEELTWYVRGYNAVSSRRLNEEYGRDIFAECWEEAGRRWRAEHPQKAGE
jgi:hypothetical protein